MFNEAWFPDEAACTEASDYADAMSDALWERLQEFYYKSPMYNLLEKDWEELSYWETEQLKRDYQKDLEESEAITDPERFYCTGGL